MGYDAAENYMFLEIHQTGVSGWIVIWGSSQEFKFLSIPYRCKIE